MRQKVVYKHGYDASCANGAPVNNFLKRKRREAAYECGQRIYIKYSNGVETTYSYKKETRLLDAIKTTSKKGSLYQNIKYDFTKAGNIKQYTNDCLSDSNGGNYRTTQSYEYDGLYQLTKASGTTELNRHSFTNPEVLSKYEQTFSFDRLGNMKTKKSSEVTVTGSKKGDDLNYEFDYEVEEGRAHRYSRIGTRYYKYDEVGNLLAEQTGAFGTEDDDNLYKIEELKEKTYGMNEGWGVFNKEESAEGSKTRHRKTDRRTYEWNAENQLVETSDEAITVGYTYGADGKRASKYTHNSETLYFNDYWVWHIDNATKDRGGKVTKNIYLGTERLASRIGSYNTYAGEENENTFFYHSDHLGSAQLVTDCNGDEYQRLEYTPYGETWIDLKTQISLIAKLPYKFSAKELDEETGLYYYGARYLDPKYSRWISADPALSYYVEGKSNGSSGGIYNSINLNLYHYAENNPIRYSDPTGLEGDVPKADLDLLKKLGEEMVKNGTINGINLYTDNYEDGCFARATVIAGELKKLGFQLTDYSYVDWPVKSKAVKEAIAAKKDPAKVPKDKDHRYRFHIAATVVVDGKKYVVDPYKSETWLGISEEKKWYSCQYPTNKDTQKAINNEGELMGTYQMRLHKTESGYVGNLSINEYAQGWLKNYDNVKKYNKNHKDKKDPYIWSGK